MTALVDTNILVYRFDPRFPDKQRIAEQLLRQGIADDDIRIPHQAIVEFVAATTRPLASGQPLLGRDDALREAEEFLMQFTVLYPTDGLVRTALRGAPAYRLSWFDAHLWAYAEYYGLAELISEDFQHSSLRLHASAQSIYKLNAGLIPRHALLARRSITPPALGRSTESLNRR